MNNYMKKEYPFNHLVVELVYWQAITIDLVLKQMWRQRPETFFSDAVDTLACGMPWRWLGHKTMEEYLAASLKIPEDIGKQYADSLQPMIERMKQVGLYEERSPISL